MKMKYYFLLATILLMAACSDHEAVESTSTNPSLSMNSIRSYAEALKIAQNAIPMLNGGLTTRSESNERKIDLSKREVIRLDAKTRTNNNANDTLIYVFNFENNEGFVLVSASKNTEGLLAITEKGHCDPSTRSNVCGFEMFLDMAKEYVANSKSRDLIDYKDSVISSTYSYVGPYITVQWGQNYAEGEFCPNGIAGCTNTAMAQIMSYYQYPSSITLTYSGRDKSSQSLYWTAIKAHATGHHVIACSDTTTHNSIGRLHRQLGDMNQSIYNPNSTSTYTKLYAKPTFNIIGYSCGNWDTYSGISVRNEINSTHIFLMSGGGHAWAFDGYMTKTDLHYEMINNGSGWVPTGEIHYSYSYYNHMNWGWYGTNNGYFSENVYDTSQAISWDSSSHYVNNNFGTNVELLSVYH